jgi:alkylation response protein AidB-like acyl-CoA dehydrogenase
MPESLSPELHRLAERTRRLLEDELRPLEQSLDADPNAAVPAEMRARVRALSRTAGLYSLAQPGEVGGGAAGPLALTVVREAIAAAHLRLGRWVLGPDPGALRQAEGDLRRRYLEPVLRGEKHGAFAFTEPHDAPAPTRAVRDGDVFVVEGAKSYVTGGAEADFFLTVVRVVQGEHDDGAGTAATRPQTAPGGAETASTGGDAAPSRSSTALLAIDRDLPGVTVEREFRSLEGGRHVALRFSGARVPVDRVVGAIGEGMPRALRAIGDTRLGVAAFAVGSSMWALDFVARHLRAPHRRGAPLSDLESIRLRFGELRIQVYAARSVLYRTARLAEAGGNVVNETMAAKVLATETLGNVADQAIQLVGGDALVVGHPLERLYREARSLRLAEGASDLLRLQIARGALELEKGRL